MGLENRGSVGAPSRFGGPSDVSGAQMRALVESVGLNRRDVARLLEVSESSVARWWMGQTRIPVGVIEELMLWVRASEALEEEILRELRATGTAHTYLADEDLPEHMARYGALFHRVAAGRALADLDQPTGEEGPARLLWA